MFEVVGVLCYLIDVLIDDCGWIGEVVFVLFDLLILMIGCARFFMVW